MIGREYFIRRVDGWPLHQYDSIYEHLMELRVRLRSRQYLGLLLDVTYPERFRFYVPHRVDVQVEFNAKRTDASGAPHYHINIKGDST